MKLITETPKLLAMLAENNLTLADYALRYEVEKNHTTPEKVLAGMESILVPMEKSIHNASDAPVHSLSGLTGGDAYRYAGYRTVGSSLLGETCSRAAMFALSASETNAAMGCIVACPTAGSCGIVPAVIFSVAEQYGKSREDLVRALLTSSAVGMLIAAKATLAGAEGGCQAECGSASAMAAAAAVEMLGGSPEQALHAGAMALKSVLGLVCDPVAGLVEIPCIKRNASGTVNALLQADLALAGVKSNIPFHEVVDAMYIIGKQMDPSLRETAMGGLAVTPTGLKLKEKVMGASTQNA